MALIVLDLFFLIAYYEDNVLFFLPSGLFVVLLDYSIVVVYSVDISMDPR